jgi:outer membrane protein assembly factor BamE (lipoprotein component of BamABCDE complex)
MSVRRALAVAAAVAGLACAGCSTMGNGRLVRLDAAQARTLLVVGRTTRDDVRTALGQGTIIRFESGLETWHYLYREGIAPGWDEVPFIGLVTARLDRPTKELVLLFDGQGVLKRWSLQSYRSAPSSGA